MDVIAGGQAAQGAVGGRHVGQAESGHRFAEGDVHHGGATEVQPGAGHGDCRRRPYRIDGVVIGGGGTAARQTIRHAGDTGIVQHDMVARAGHARIWGERRRPGEAAIIGDDAAQGAVGDRQVGVGETGDGQVEGNGHLRSAANVLGRVRHYDGRGRRRCVGGVHCTAVVEDIVHGSHGGTRAASTQRRATGTAATDVAAHGRKVGGRHQQRAFVPDRTNAFARRAARVC